MDTVSFLGEAIRQDFGDVQQMDFEENQFWIYYYNSPILFPIFDPFNFIQIYTIVVGFFNKTISTCYLQNNKNKYYRLTNALCEFSWLTEIMACLHVGTVLSRMVQ